MSDVRDWGAFIRGRWSWTRFGYEKGFPRNSQFSDIDAIAEFNGLKLYIEAKGYDGTGDLVGLDEGQIRMLRELAKEPGTTALILWGCASCNDPYVAHNVGTNERYDWRGLGKEERRKNLKQLIDQCMGLI